jgi:phosphoenolpyruvate carboxykinase (ATP)
VASTTDKDLSAHGISATVVHKNLSRAALIETAIRRNEGQLTSDGSFVAITKPHTGRSPNDKFVVKDATTESQIWWEKNGEMSPAQYDALKKEVVAHLSKQELFVSDLFCGADPKHRLNVQAVSPNAWQMSFVNNMFIRPKPDQLKDFKPGFTIIHAPEFQADPAKHGTKSSTFIVLNFADRTVMIGGTRYAGEMKKSIFTVMNYLMPQEGVFPMHCSANVGKDGDVSLFFGLSGTGKTTLSADPNRALIGDDEHGWSERGVCNIEGGNYAQVVKLSAEGEPLIWEASRQFGTILENVVIDPDTREPDFEDISITENIRSSYPIEFIPGAVLDGMGGHPKNVMMLTADAFGVLPPIAKLTKEQAMYHFLSGYTAKVAGTERGVTEPAATFSTCFGAPFLPLRPSVYAKLLGQKLDEHDSTVWLVNTGWTGGPPGEGSRMKLAYTRAMVTAALTGQLDDVATKPDPVFGLPVPVAIPGVPAEALDARGSWKDAAAYDAQAAKLAGMFRDNFKKFEDGVSDAVKQAGPK